VRRDKHPTRLPVAGGDAIGHAILGQQAGDEISAGLDPSTERRVVAEQRAAAAVSEVSDVLNTKRAAVEDHRL
jgi:hypothetical protein